MRRQKVTSGIFLVVAVMIIAAGVYLALRTRELPKVRGREVVKHFTFSSPKELSEWEEKLLAGGKTEYALTEFGGKPCVRAVSKNSASTLFYKQRLSRDRSPFVSWDWKAEKFPVEGLKESLTRKEGFDFAAQVYVVFHSKFFLNMKAIQYVWTREVPEGTVSVSPYTKNVRLMVLESGESEEWKHEERNVNEDFRELFGVDPEKDVAVISFMTDSDSTSSTAEAYYGNVTLGYLEMIPGKQSKSGAGDKKRGTEIEVKKRKRDDTKL